MVSLNHSSHVTSCFRNRGELCFTASLDCALKGLSRWSISSFCRLEIFPLYSFDNSFFASFSFSFFLSSFLFSAFPLSISRICLHRSTLFVPRMTPRYPSQVRLPARLYYRESALEMRFTSRTSETWLVYSPMKCRFIREKDVSRWIVKLTWRYKNLL